MSGSSPVSLPLSIWTTGAPVPSAERARGSFFDMIVRHTRPVFDGTHRNIDVTQLRTRSEFDEVLGEETCGIIVTGSPAMVGDDHEWIRQTMQALVQVHNKRIPILGICFGHQLLGQALGGKVERNPAGREIGTYALASRAADPLLDGIQSPPVVVMTHLDSVTVAPTCATVLASTPLDPHAAVRFSDTTWGVQFHPEMDAEIVSYYLSERREVIEGEGIDVAGLLKARKDSSFGSELLQRFALFCKNGARFL